MALFSELHADTVELIQSKKEREDSLGYYRFETESHEMWSRCSGFKDTNFCQRSSVFRLLSRVEYGVTYNFKTNHCGP